LYTAHPVMAECLWFACHKHLNRILKHRKVMHGCNKGWGKTIVNSLVRRDADEKAGRECGLEQAHGRGSWGEREGGE
jgi:hypothetical protein